jgi:long-chain acyl-CoA synthetase
MLLYRWLEEVVESKGGAKALIYRDTYLSWRGLLHRVDRRASEFEAAGVRPGDWVGLMLGNVPDFVILALALSKLEAAPLPLDPTTSTRELEMVMATTPLRGLVTRPRGGDAPLPSSTTAPKKSSSSPKKTPPAPRKQVPESRRRLQGTLLSCSIYPTEQRTLAEDPAERIGAILVTSDSAGDPKPVDRTYRNLAAEARNVTTALSLDGEDRALLSIPLFHSFGFDVGLVSTIRAGAAICLEDEVAPNRLLKLVREQRITLLPGSSTLFEEMAKLPSARPLTHRPVRFGSLGAGLAGSSHDSFNEKYGIRPLSWFHTAETGTVSIDLKGVSGDTVGKPLAGVEVRVTHPQTGKPQPFGKAGVLWVRSEAVSPLSISTPQAQDGEVPVGGRDRDGWYRTGDLASVDRAGRLHLQGRQDDMVRIEGKRVALGEVEGCIETYPKVSSAQAMVVTDPLGGPMVVARVVLKDRARVDPEAIIDHCARHLSPYKVPRRIEICGKI